MKMRVGTRGSQLAIIQAKAFLQELKFKTTDYELVIVKTVGDVRQEERFVDVGVKGIFTKELDEALLQKKIDFAIHSLKDIPSQLHPEIEISNFSRCLDPRDAFVSLKYKSIQDLPKGAIVGTSSARRNAQVLKFRQDLKTKELRGNVETRIQKLEAGQYDAIVLAVAGLQRMEMNAKISEYLNPTQFVPCIRQGVVAVTTLISNQEIKKILAREQDQQAFEYAQLLRDFMRKADGGCSVPIGCYLEIKSDIISIWGYLSDMEGKDAILENVQLPKQLQHTLVDKLFSVMNEKGYRRLLDKLHRS